MSFNVVSEVASKNHCIGCGVCTAICPQSVLQMQLAPSSSYEVRQIPGCDERCDLCLKVCPFYQKDGFEDALNRKIYADLPNQSGDFAKFLNTYEFYKKDEAQRLSSASGGAGNFIFNALFENGLIDYAICAQSVDNASYCAPQSAAMVQDAAEPQNTSAAQNFKEDAPQNLEQSSDASQNLEQSPGAPLFKFAVIKSAGELERTKKSAYYPLSLGEALKFIAAHDGAYAISALPCFAKALRLICEKNRRIKSRVKFIIGLVCGQSKSANFARKLANNAFGEEVSLASADFRYKIAGASAMSFGFKFRDVRGREAVDDRGSSAELYWSSRAFTPLACNRCVDVFAKCADAVLMDAWLSPQVADFRGSSLVITRDERIDELFKKGGEFCESISPTLVQSSQQSVVDTKNEIFYGTKNPLKKYIYKLKFEIQNESARSFECDDFIAVRVRKIRRAARILAYCATAKFLLGKLAGKLKRKNG